MSRRCAKLVNTEPEDCAMSISLRQPKPEDADAVGQLVHDAFASIDDKHNFPRDFPTPDLAKRFMHGWINHPRVWGALAAEDRPDGKIVGCNFLDQRDTIAGVGPICIEPNRQGGGIGRRLMQAVLDHAKSDGAPGVRLMQDAYNVASMSLYASCGFDAKEPCALMTGKIAGSGATADVRPMREPDLSACAELCRGVHGFDRVNDLRDALRTSHPFVLDRGGRIVAYTSAPTFWPLNHGVAESLDDMKHLLAGASAQLEAPLAMIVPIRNTDLFRWCLSARLKTIKPMTLMAIGEYREPKGCWYPSVLY
jgi:predicted N-acetyltransferase YhbS